MKKMKKNILKKIFAVVMTSSLLMVNTTGADALSSIDSIMGKDRYLTAGQIAARQSYSTAIIVNSQNSLADGLSASGLAGVVKAPILLTKKDKLPLETELRLGTTNKVYLIGSEGSISNDIEEGLRAGGIKVIRIGGLNRYQTSVNVAKEIMSIKGQIGKTFIANGKIGEADAMSISSVAARDGEPIILTNGKKIDSEARMVVNQARKVYAIGGTNALSDDLIIQTNSNRLGGKNRFQTNEFIVKYFYPEASSFYITDGYKLVDALTGGPLSAYDGRPIVLVSKNNPNANVVRGAKRITAIGGVSQATKNAVIAAANR